MRDESNDFFDLTLKPEDLPNFKSNLIDSDDVLLKDKKLKSKLKLCDYNEYESYSKELEIAKKTLWWRR